MVRVLLLSLYKILDELRSLKLWKEKQERKEKGKKRVEEISQDEREKIREEEKRKIMKEMKREKHSLLLWSGVVVSATQ